MSSATTEDQTESQGKPEATEQPEDWPVASRYGGRPIFSDDLRGDMRAGGVVHAVEVLADVQGAVRELLKRAFDNLEHEGVRHTVGNAIDLAHTSAENLRRAATLFWMERKGEVEVSEWPCTPLDYDWSSDASENGGDPSKVDVDALYEIAVLAQYALGTAADGELEDLTGVSSRKVFAALSGHLDNPVKDAGRLLNRDEDAVLDAAAERVRELAGGE